MTGATGNIGTSVVAALSEDPGTASVVGVARRRPEWTVPKTEWVAADVTRDDITEIVRGADAVVHLAWQFQPTHEPAQTWQANVLGSRRVFDAVRAAGVPVLVYSSSVGAYSPGPKDRAVDESWPTDGWPLAAYTREKAYLERTLDAFERSNPDVRVVRLRPAFVFKRVASDEQRRLFAGGWFPGGLVRPGLIPFIPALPGMTFQVVHAADLAQAFLAAIDKDVTGPFNIAADPVVDADLLADVLNARAVRVPVQPVRAALAAAWRLHIVPASPDLLDAVLRLPVMDTTRARTVLGWSPQHDARTAINELLVGLRDDSALPTAPLAGRS